MGKDKPNNSKKDEKLKEKEPKVDTEPVVDIPNKLAEEISKETVVEPGDLYEVLTTTSSEEASALEELVEKDLAPNIYATEVAEYNSYSQYPNAAEDEETERFKDLTETHKFIKKSSADYQASLRPGDEIE